MRLQYLGNAEGFDGAVWRGDRDGGRFSVFYTKDGAVDAVLAVNDSRTLRASRDLIRLRRTVDAGVLSSETADLRALANV